MYIDHVLSDGTESPSPNDRPGPGWAADVGVEFARQHCVQMYPSIQRAVMHGGEMVDAVLIIAEHGDYGWNERGRHMYPRRFFFEQVSDSELALARCRPQCVTCSA